MRREKCLKENSAVWKTTHIQPRSRKKLPENQGEELKKPVKAWSRCDAKHRVVWPDWAVSLASKSTQRVVVINQ